MANILPNALERGLDGTERTLKRLSEKTTGKEKRAGDVAFRIFFACDVENLTYLCFNTIGLNGASAEVNEREKLRIHFNADPPLRLCSPEILRFHGGIE